MKIRLKRLLFYWGTSFILATILYYILWLIMPYHYVFGALYRMFLYHWQYPIAFIAIPCFFYGIMATLLTNKFSSQSLIVQIFLTLVIIFLTITASLPFGGMLWHYCDMRAGHFPPNWFNTMITLGFDWGLEFGWLVIGLSIPYNIICAIGCYFLTKKGSELFK